MLSWASLVKSPGVPRAAVVASGVPGKPIPLRYVPLASWGTRTCTWVLGPRALMDTCRGLQRWVPRNMGVGRASHLGGQKGDGHPGQQLTQACGEWPRWRRTGLGEWSRARTMFPIVRSGRNACRLAYAVGAYSGLILSLGNSQDDRRAQSLQGRDHAQGRMGGPGPRPVRTASRRPSTTSTARTGRGSSSSCSARNRSWGLGRAQLWPHLWPQRVSGTTELPFRMLGWEVPKVFGGR